MQLKITREPDSSLRSGSATRSKSYPFKLGVPELDTSRLRQCILFGFQTGDGRKSRFDGVIPPEQFESLAKLMMKADPQAAIRAFGAAMQGLKIKQDAGIQ